VRRQRSHDRAECRVVPSDATPHAQLRWALLDASNSAAPVRSSEAEAEAPREWSQRAVMASMGAALVLAPAEPAHAALLKNVPEWAQNVFGVLYLAFFGAFLLRVFNKRAKFATSTVREPLFLGSLLAAAGVGRSLRFERMVGSRMRPGDDT
jgi:hypothetical protein